MKPKYPGAIGFIKLSAQMSGIALLLSLAITAGSWSAWIAFQPKGSWWRKCSEEVQSLFLSPDTQPWILASLAIYILVFLFRARCHLPGQTARLLGLATLSGFVIASYYLHEGSSHTFKSDALVLCGAVVIGLGLNFLISLSTRPRSKWLQPVFFILILIFAAGSMSENSSNLEYQYRGVERHTGIWKNPNTFGLLMGCGLVLSLGSLIQAGWQNLPAEARNRPFLKRWAWLLLLPLCGVLFAGLIQSLSRGAWLGTGLALMWLGHHFLKLLIEAPGSTRSPSGLCCRLSWLNRNQIPLMFLLLAVGILSFWAFRHTDHPYVRRAFTVGNPADHSWRNRVLAYEQALQMMGDRPFAGYGWSGWQEIHREFYQPSTQIEGAAITLNDYFVLGITSGTLALIAFISYIWLTVFPKQSQPDAPPTPDAFLHRVAHAGAIVLLVGFWFDGGLFKLALATPFWVLMELGYRADLSPDEAAADVKRL